MTDHEDNIPTPTGPHPDSAAGRFRQQKVETVATVNVDLEVPGWDGLWVRFTPVPPDKIRGAYRKREKLRDRQALAAAIDLLADHCTGIYWEVDGEQESADPDGPWPTFGPRILALIGASGSNAEDAVRAVYGNGASSVATDYRLLEAAGDLIEASQEPSSKAEEEHRGN